MIEGIKNENINCLVFNARFDSENQYKIRTKFSEKEEVMEAFLWEERYHTSINTHINEEYITKIEKI